MVKKTQKKDGCVGKDGSDASLHETIKTLSALKLTLQYELAELKKDKVDAEGNDFKDKVKDNDKGEDKGKDKDKGKTSFHFFLIFF